VELDLFKIGGLSIIEKENYVGDWNSIEHTKEGEESFEIEEVKKNILGKRD